MASGEPVEHNGNMTGNAFIRWLLLAAHVLACAVMFTLSRREDGFPGEYVVSLWLGLAASQIILTAVWAVMRIDSCARRLPLLVGALLFWIFNNGRVNENYATWVAFFVPLAAATAIVAAAARFFAGARWVSADELTSFDESDQSRQFTIRSMMFITAVVAVCCMLLQFVLKPWMQFGKEMLPFFAASLSSGTAILFVYFRRDAFGLLRGLAWFASIAGGVYLRSLGSPGLPIEAAIMLSATECSSIALTCAALRASKMWLLTGRQQSDWRRRNQAFLDSDNIS
jgi:hypothetical protein